MKHKYCLSPFDFLCKVGDFEIPKASKNFNSKSVHQIMVKLTVGVNMTNIEHFFGLESISLYDKKL